MQTVSAKFLRAVRTSGQRKTVINISESFGATYIFQDVPILDGSITVDRNSEVHRSGTIKIGERSITDVFFNNHAGPFGMEVEVRSGIVFPDGSEELVKLGVFNIDQFSWLEGDGGWPVVELNDRSKWIQRAPLVSPKDYSGKLAQTVMTEIITEIIPSVTISYQVGLANPRLPGGSVFDSDRWEVVKTCAEAMAAEVYFDPDGVFQVIEARDATALASEAVYEFNVGNGFDEIQGEDFSQKLVRRPEGNLITANRSVGRETTYNGIVVFGAAPSATVGQPYALAFDNDPNSPTYYDGPFGKAIKRVDNSLLTNVTQCSEAAVAILKNSLGLARSINFTAVGNPALEAGDYVLFTFTNGAQETHLLDSFTYPLGPGVFEGATRTNPTRQTASVGVEAGTGALTPGEPSAPGKPTVLSATNTTITIKWTASDPDNAPIKNYEIWANKVLRKTVGPTIRSTTITGLTAGTSYEIYLRAVDTLGAESNQSERSYKKTTGSSSTPEPEKDTYVKTYYANWSAAYTGSNSRASWHGSEIHQGYVSGGNGNMRSLIGFDDARIRSDTSGAEILECKITLYFRHWWGSSGTAVIGTHSYDARPGSWNNASVYQDRVRSGRWPKPGKRTVNLGVTIGNNFRTGAAKGISIGPGPSSSTTYYGRAAGTGSGSLTPVLTIKYRK